MSFIDYNIRFRGLLWINYNPSGTVRLTDAECAAYFKAKEVLCV